ncbi:MAG: site-specific integrase [Clostridia bacterium]|nr:site-specific integrase [Clostridia bacterium]
MRTNIVALPSPETRPKPKTRPKNLTSDGRRCVRVDAGTDPATGKRIRKAFYGKTLREAQAKADEFRRAVADGIDVVSQRQQLSEWIDTWLEAYGSHRGGYSVQGTHRRNAEKLRAALGGTRLCDIRQLHIQRFADDNSGYSKSQVDKLRATTQLIFRAAVANRIITFDPTSEVNWRHQGEGSHRSLTREEIAVVRQHSSGEGYMPLAAMLMLFAGLRRGEVLALRWEDIDRDAGVIHVRHGVHYEGDAPVLGAPKTKAAVRDVPILPPLVPLLASPGEGWVLKDGEGKQPSQNRFEVDWGRYQRKTGLSIRTHDLRHTFVTLLYDAGVDVKTTQTWVGHTSPAITMSIYTHLTTEKEQVSLERTAAFMQQFC